MDTGEGINALEPEMRKSRKKEAFESPDLGDAAVSLFTWLENPVWSGLPDLGQLQCAGIRVR
jgi:hypothetical protein